MPTHTGYDLPFVAPARPRATEPPSRRATEPPSRRATEPPSHRAAEPLERTGETRRARNRYEGFIAIWRDADRAFRPPIEHARRRVAALR